MKLNIMKKIMILLPAILAGNPLICTLDTVSLKDKTSLKKILAAAISAYKPKAKKQPVLTLAPHIREKVKNGASDELEAHKQTQKLIEELLPDVADTPDIAYFTGEVTQEELNEFAQDVVDEIRRNEFSIIYMAVEDQLDEWEAEECKTPELQKKIEAGRYVFKHLRKIELGLNVLGWLTTNEPNKIRGWLQGTPQYKIGMASVDMFYRKLKAELANEDDNPTGEMAIDSISKLFTTAQATKPIGTGTEDQKQLTIIVEDIQKAAEKTKELYGYAFSGINDPTEAKEEKITSLILLLDELFEELDRFTNRYFETGLKDLVRQLKKEEDIRSIKIEGLENLEKVLLAIKLLKFTNWTVDKLNLLDEDSWASKIIKRFI